MTRKEALAELIEKVEAGGKYETAGHTIMCQRAFPKPDDFDGSREAYSKSAAQQAILAWKNGSLDAAKALHEAVLPGWPYTIENVTGQNYRAWTNKSRNLRTPGFSDRGPCPARAWLLAILRALYARETD